MKFSFLIPERKEQIKIAEFLSKIDLSIKSLSDQLTKSKKFKKGLLQKCLCNMDLTAIHNEIQEEFESYLASFLDNKKYYYWTLDYFESVGDLSFQHYFLSDAAKKEINLKGESYFTESKISFSINNNSHRNDLTIKNISTLFEDHKEDGQTKRYEYIKEYILWQLLTQLDKKDPHHKIELQKNNFLYTYLQYLINNQAPRKRSNFIAYAKAEQGRELFTQLQI